ncbi:hypothetical protein [Rhodopirellula baltica]
MINPGSVNEPVHAAKLFEGERLVDEQLVDELVRRCRSNVVRPSSSFSHGGQQSLALTEPEGCRSNRSATFGVEWMVAFEIQNGIVAQASG